MCLRSPCVKMYIYISILFADGEQLCLGKALSTARVVKVELIKIIIKKNNNNNK